MASHLPQLQRFFYSHYFIGGLRQAIGVLLPAVVLISLFQMYGTGMVASVGAACVAVIDQPGNPRRNSINMMLVAVLLGSATAAVTGLATAHILLIWLAVPALCFLFSMLTVYGKQGGLMAFACLLVMTLTLRTPMAPQAVLLHTISTFLGGLFYFVYSYTMHRLMWHREEQQTLSVALFATAEYVAVRARFYDVNMDLETCYRDLVHTQADMIEKHQAARNMVLREQPTGRRRTDARRYASLNMFIDMVAMLDSLVATHTDYATLRRHLPESDVLIFARDTLFKLSDNIDKIALNISRNQPTTERHSAKAELRAIEYELDQYRQSGFAQAEPEVYALLVQILRRLRNCTRIVERMAKHTRNAKASELVDLSLEKALGRFLSRSDIRFGMITSNLRLDSSHFRYAIRVAAASVLALAASTALSYFAVHETGIQVASSHGYWIILTIIIILKPGYALTRQRNGLRLTGTLLGCVLALLLFNINHNPNIDFAVLVVTCIVGYSLIQVNYMASATFTTIYILAVFHLISPGSNFVIGERLVDTFIGGFVAAICGYILPWWEYSFMGSLAKATRNANQRFLTQGLHYAELNRKSLPATGVPQEQATQLADELHEADLAWRLARKTCYIAFGNYASAFYRMMSEPARRQRHVPELNHLLIQFHVLSSQISAAIPLLAALPAVPKGIQQSLDAIDALLRDQDAKPPLSIETDGDLALLAYPVRQMVKAAQLIHHEMHSLEPAQPMPTLGRVKPQESTGEA
jgi:uncharacterized membrane protein YccC